MVLCAALSGWVGSLGAAEPEPVRLLKSLDLPEDLVQARDVRWLSEDSLLLGVFGRGAVRFLLGSPARAQTLIAESQQRTGLSLTFHVAASKSYFAAAGPLFVVAWTSRAERNGVFVEPFAQIGDFDVHGQRIALLGGWRGDGGAWSPDGSIAWLADLEARDPAGGASAPAARTSPDPFGGLQPVYPVADPKIGIGRCGILGLGAVRFLPNGSLVIVPGVEPGVYLVDPEGRRSFTWDTVPLDFFTGCPLDERETETIHRDQVARYEWLDRRVVLDDIVPLGAGPEATPGLVIRRVIDDRVTWELIRLHREEDPERFPLPFTSEVRYAHLKADGRDGRLVFLVYDPFAFQDPARSRATLHFATLESLARDAGPPSSDPPTADQTAGQTVEASP